MIRQLFLISITWFLVLADLAFPNRGPFVTNAADLSALGDLFTSTGGVGWANWSRWRSGDPCKAKWTGITCNLDANEMYHITGISLPSNNLVRARRAGSLSGPFTFHLIVCRWDRYRRPCSAFGASRR